MLDPFLPSRGLLLIRSLQVDKAMQMLITPRCDSWDLGEVL